MSSTTGVQNLLTNVFRPIFVWDVTNNVYQTKLELINIDTVSANTVTAYAGNIGDSKSNVYVGVGAGRDYSVLMSTSNACNTFVGTGAGGSTSNVTNSVFLGFHAGFGSIGSANSISIGANTLNGGNSNIYIGANTGIASGSNNIFIGSSVNNGNVATSNTLLIGNGSSPTIIGDLSNRRVGINLSSLPVTYPSLSFDVSGYARIGTTENGGLGINKLPGYYTLDVNGDMQVSDGYGVLTFTHDSNSNSVTSISNTASYPNCNATLQVTGGFFSKNGTTIAIPTGTGVIIGKWKKGITVVSAQDTASSSNYATQIVLVTVTSGVYTLVPLVASNSPNTDIIQSSGSNINLVSSTGSSTTYTYSITYLPMP
jgi:hypothetical protein